MNADIKTKLEERNSRIINAIIQKSEALCPGAIALIGIAGSFHSGDIYEKSDLDLCIVMNDDRGRKLSTCFILDDVAFDIYLTRWRSLESMSEYNDPYITKLLELDIIYCSDEKHMQKYMELRSKVADILNQPFSLKDLEKTQKHINEACIKYTDLMLSDQYGECRFAASEMLYYIEFAIYMFNKTYVKKGVKRIPEEICAMSHLPTDFMNYHRKLINATSIEATKDAGTSLMKVVKDFAAQMEDRVRSKKEITANDLKGTYEEIYSNWKNKMTHACDRDDAYLSLMTASSCQSFYNDMAGEYQIEKINLMAHIRSDNLALSAKAFDEAMEAYKKNYDKLNATIVYYKDLDEFEEGYYETL